MKAETEQVHWLVFFNDQLLLEKKDNKCVLPLGVQPPVKPLADTTIHSITTPMGQVCKAFSIDEAVHENEKFFMTGLRASYDCLPYSQYQIAGKAHEILH